MTVYSRRTVVDLLIGLLKTEYQYSLFLWAEYSGAGQLLSTLPLSFYRYQIKGLRPRSALRTVIVVLVEFHR